MRLANDNACARCAAFTLAEVVVSIFIAGLLFGGIITAYIQGGRRADWSGLSLAAQALAIQQIEQARSAVWDPAHPVYEKNELAALASNLLSFNYNIDANGNTNWSGYSWTNLDLPISGTNVTTATNFVTLTRFAPITGIKMDILKLRVDTVWQYSWGSKVMLCTNTMVDYYAPDNPAN
jgi:type II secretory pathway pseudopilin PulG